MDAPTQFPIRQLNGQQPKSAEEIAAEKGAVIGIMGDPDAGKTTLMHSLLTDPNMYPICMLHCDGGAHVLDKHATQDGRIQIYNSETWPDSEQQVNELCNDIRPFKSVWVDCLSVYGDLAIEYHGVHDIPRENVRGRQQTYGESNWDTLLFQRKLIDKLAIAQGVNVFFVYWATDPVVQENSGSVIKKKYLLMSPALAKKTLGVLDIVIYLEKKQGLQPYPPQAILYGMNNVETRMRLAPTNPLKSWPPIITDLNLAAMVRGFRGEPYDPKTASLAKVGQ